MVRNNEECQNHPSSSSSAPHQHLHDISKRTRSLSDSKRRLKAEQVKALERSFELSTKLESERKLQLAMNLDLQPRQVAVWFQNRRARWKTKKLEKDYDALRRQLLSLQADNVALKSQNKKLHSQLVALRSRDPVMGFQTDGHCHAVFPSSGIGGPGAATPTQVLDNVFGGSQQGIWPWPEQENFN